MASLRPMTAALAAIALAGAAQAWTVNLPPCLDPFQPFVYSGCYANNGNPNTLSFRSEMDRDTATVEKCVAWCKGNGYRYAGLEYYGVCYCGQTVDGPQLADSECDFPCNGDKSETCGGNNKMSIYQDPTFLPFDDSIDIDDYVSLGCWTDDSHYGKALAYPQDQLSFDTMTNEKCLKACRDGGFPYAGTEYSGECWCGVVIGNDTFSAPAEQCDMPCKGNPDEKCGGRGRLSIYAAKDLESLEPCGYVPPKPSSSYPVVIPSSVAPTTSTTSSSSSTSSTKSSTTTPPPVVTTPPPTTTKSSSSTKTSSVCKETVTIPSTCEYKCGNWCAQPLPDWKDTKNCQSSHSHCKLQLASCFKNAGFPGALECFGFADWCTSVDTYCKKPPSSGCNKPDFWKKHPPKSHKPPTTTVITTTCKPSATSSTKTTSTKTTPTPTPTQVVPVPSNICIQPSNWFHGYGPGKPVGDIELPIVTCNDLASEFNSKPFKLYNSPFSNFCKGYPRHSVNNACLDACDEQYDDCVKIYAEQCRKNRRRDISAPEGVSAKTAALDRRTFYWGWNDKYNTAVEKCKAQRNDCRWANQGLQPGNKCSKYGKW
ncbi:WSC domain containing protein [Naviculisporaceae sp. PSN 640]